MRRYIKKNSANNPLGLQALDYRHIFVTTPIKDDNLRAWPQSEDACQVVCVITPQAQLLCADVIRSHEKTAHDASGLFTDDRSPFFLGCLVGNAPFVRQESAP